MEYALDGYTRESLKRIVSTDLSGYSHTAIANKLIQAAAFKSTLVTHI